MGNKALDIGPAVFATVCAVAGVTMFDSPAVRTLAGLPLIFYLPGRAILCAAGMNRRNTLESIVLTTGLSIAVTIFCGLALNLVGPLTPIRWAVALAAITLGGYWRAQRSAVGRDLLPFRPLLLPALSGKRALMLAGSVAIAVTAITWSRFDAQAYREFAFTELWMVQEPNGTAVTVGIRNAERAPSSYDLEVVVDNHLVAARRGIDLNVGEKWLSEFVWPVADGKAHAAEARLFKRGEDGVVYRRVWLHTDAKEPRT